MGNILKKLTLLSLLISCKILDKQQNTADVTIIKTDKYGHIIDYDKKIKKDETPLKVYKINKNINDTSECIVNNIQNKFKLSNNFIRLVAYADNSQSIKIYNPYTKTEGIIIDVIPQRIQTDKIKKKYEIKDNGVISIIKLYANGISKVSKAWINIIDSCIKKN